MSLSGCFCIIFWSLLLLFIDFPGGAVVKKKNPPSNAGDARGANLIPQSEKSPGVGNGNPLQHFPSLSGRK